MCLRLLSLPGFRLSDVLRESLSQDHLERDVKYQQIFYKRSKRLVVKVYEPYTNSDRVILTLGSSANPVCHILSYTNILPSSVKMSSSQTTTTNGVVVITHVHPYGNGVGVPGVEGVASTPHCLGQTVFSVLGSFQAGHPKALGAVQIMIGLMMLVTGTVMAAAPWLDNIGVASGIFVWGSIIYVIAGSLTVAADNKLNKCLVEGSLGMNVVATVTALTGIILHSLDSAGIMLYCDYPYHYPHDFCQQYWVRSQGISGVLAVFSLLEFIVSICVSSFACRAVCLCCHSTPEVSL
eukprot:XP_013989642.1 PREDICTED: membrane-spanning 4-domains subfamily A member 4A-like [Salmo salar]